MRFKFLPIFFWALFLGLHGQAQEGGSEKKEDPNKILDSGKYEFFKGQKTNIKDPFKLRDPFKRDIKTEKETKRSKYNDFDFSNLPSIEDVPVDRIRIVGVLLGEDPRAIARIAEGSSASQSNVDEDLSDETYILREGMKLGKHDAEIKAILPGGVVLAEKILNVYDEEEYLETILPVQTQ